MNQQSYEIIPEVTIERVTNDFWCTELMLKDGYKMSICAWWRTQGAIPACTIEMVYAKPGDGPRLVLSVTDCTGFDKCLIRFLPIFKQARLDERIRECA